MRPLFWTLSVLTLSNFLATEGTSQDISFFDGFENGLSQWELVTSERIEIVDSGTAKFGQVLSLSSGHARVYALIENSENWNHYRIEADFMFPEPGHSYMGLIYHYNESDARTDFGSIYVKGNGSYIRVNPRRDHNAHRTLYEEYKTPLTGEAAIEIGRWQHFKAEVIDSVCHFYVGNMTTPQVTFDALEFSSGAVGFKPRVVGAPVWLDNVHVTAIDRFSYDGPPKPRAFDYEPEQLVTDWQMIGPFCGPMTVIEEEGFRPEIVYKQNGQEYHWREFKTDRRGCVVSGRITEFLGGRSVAYFHTEVNSETKKEIDLQLSTREELALWWNGEFLGYDSPDRYAWYDFWKNEDHRGSGGKVTAQPGRNTLLIRVRGGKYAGGGFYLRLQEVQANQPNKH